MLKARDEDGSAVIESVFAMLALLILVLGVIEVAFALYARNVIASATHDGARAAIEIGSDASDARERALMTIDRAAGGLISGADVAVHLQDGGSGIVEATVVVTARLHLLGPVPIDLPIRTVARATGLRTVP